MPRLSRELLAGLEDSIAYNEAAHKRLEKERAAVLKCLAREAGAGRGASDSFRCAPGRLDRKLAPPKPQVYWDAVAAGLGPAFNDTGARAIGHTMRRVGVDWLVQTDPPVLRRNKHLYDEGHPETMEAVQRLLAEAESLLDVPLEVIPDKPFTPPDGDKRSYVSLVPNCWPANPDDLENPQGPWKCRNSEPFPGSLTVAPDAEKLARVQRQSFTLALAWYFSEDARFGLRGAAGIRAFFLDPQSGMLPHLRFAGLDPSTGRAGNPRATSDNAGMSLVFDAVAILTESTYWVPEDATRMSRWASEYILHLQSDHCREVQAAGDVQGTLFDVQYTSLLAFIGRNESVIEYLHDAAMPRLRSQIYGSVVPRELAQPASFAGENFALAAFARLALQAARVDVDLWSFGSETGNSILDAWDWMLEHWCDRGGSLWPLQQAAGAAVGLDSPVALLGAMYTTAVRRGGPRGYTHRARAYALAWHALRAGPDPSESLSWDVVVTRQLSMVKFDNCFISTCPRRAVLPEDPPTYPASCLPGADDSMPFLNGMRGRWEVAAGTGAADAIRAAFEHGDPRPPRASSVPAPPSPPLTPEGTPATDSGTGTDIPAAEGEGAQYNSGRAGAGASEVRAQEDAARTGLGTAVRAAGEKTEGLKDPSNGEEGQAVVLEHGRHETVAGDDGVQKLSVTGGVTLQTQDGMRQAWPVRLPAGGAVFLALVLLMLGVLRYRTRARPQKIA